jgi:hypothetical protein
MKTLAEKKLQKDLACLQEAFYWSPCSRNCEGVSVDFIKKSVIPSFRNMVERAESILKDAESSKTRHLASDFINQVTLSLNKANLAAQQ